MSESDKVRQRATRAILQNAIFSWQVGFTVVFTAALVALVGDPFPFWQPWFWLIGGGAAAGGFVLANLNDPNAAQQAIAREFSSHYDLRDIKNRVARKRLEDAMEYRRNMLELVDRAQGAMRLQLNQTVDDIDAWIGHMYDLAQHIDGFEENELIERDRREVPQMLDKARIRMDNERDPAIRRELERQVQQLEQQLANLEATVNTMRRAEIQLESTLASLGTIYAQMSNLGTKEVDSARAQRLRLEIQDQVAGLQDTIEAMDEVQSMSLRLR